MATLAVTPNFTSVYTRQIVKLTGTGTAWLSSPPVLSISNISGCSIALNAVISNTVAFALLTTGGAGNLGNSPARIDDSASSSFTFIAVNFIASGTPAFATVDDVSFSGNVSAGGAGSTITGGKDVTGGAWAISSSKLVGTKSNANLTSDPWIAQGIGTSLNQCVSQTFIGTDNSDGYITALLRQQPAAGPGLVAVLHNTTSGSPTLNIYHQKADGTFLTGPAIFTSGVTNMNTGHTYRFESYALGIPLRLYFKIFDETAGTTLYDSSTFPYPSESWGEITGYFDHPGTCGPTIRFISVTLTHVKTQAAPDAFGQPAVTRAGTSATSIGLSATAPTGTTGAITYQWYRSAAPGFTPGGGNVLAGATGSTLSNTPPDGSLYYYKVVATDSAAPANVVMSQDFAAMLYKSPLVIGFMGDSIEIIVPSGGFRDFPDAVGQHLSQLIGAQRQVTVVNQGVASTKSSEWLVDSANYTTAKAAFIAAGASHVVVMLGSNDCAQGILAADFAANLQPVVNDLLSSGFLVILVPPPYRYLMAGPINGQASLLLGYGAAFRAMAAASSGVTVVSSDMWSYSAQVNETLDGLHPNAAGVESFGWYVARDILNSLTTGSTTSLYSDSGGGLSFLTPAQAQALYNVEAVMARSATKDTDDSPQTFTTRDGRTITITYPSINTRTVGITEP